MAQTQAGGGPQDPDATGGSMADSPELWGNSGLVGDGRYRLTHRLGRGGMAEVFAAEDVRLGRTVAVKLLRSDLAEDPVSKARFTREAQSVAGPQPPRRRRGLRLRRGVDRRQRHAVHRDGAGRGPHDPRPAAQRRGAAARAGADHRLRCAGGAGLQPPARHRAPRHQARQRHHHQQRRGQGDGLRHRPRPARRVQHHDPDRHGHGHAAVPLPRAGARQDRRHPLRPVRHGLPALRTAHAAAAVHRRDPALGRLPARPGRARRCRPRSPTSCRRSWTAW